VVTVLDDGWKPALGCCPIITTIRRLPMLGLMQSQPLLISSLIEFAARNHADGR
jgi:hypothetical protein